MGAEPASAKSRGPAPALDPAAPRPDVAAMTMASLRLATTDDADTIAHLCRELLAFYGIPPPYSRWAMAEAFKE